MWSGGEQHVTGGPEKFTSTWRQQVHRRHVNKPYRLLSLGLVLLLCLCGYLDPQSQTIVGKQSDARHLFEVVEPDESDVLPSCATSNVAFKTDQCLFVSEYCTEQSILKYMAFYYCDLEPAVWYVIFIPVLVYLLYLLSDTADAYFCDSIQTIVDCHKMSPNVAGVTLLALGNGCPDVFSSLAAFAGGSAPELGAAELAGSGALLTTVVVSMVVFASTSKVRCECVSLSRDTLWFVLALCYVMVRKPNKPHNLHTLLLRSSWDHVK